MAAERDLRRRCHRVDEERPAMTVELSRRTACHCVRPLLFVALTIGIIAHSGWCATVPSSALETLAQAEFSNLTPAERSLLKFAGSYSSEPGGFAPAGPSAKLDDPSNDPSHADKWGREREVRAELIRWLCVDPRAK